MLVYGWKNWKLSMRRDWKHNKGSNVTKLDCLRHSIRKCVRGSFQVGDLALAVRRPIITTHWTENKFLSKWDGQYVVKEAYTNGAYKLVAKDGLRIGPINEKFLKRYYA
ncbi:UNVERIFIED_CONTAM: hypothetical protein Sradi_6968300 [Sesamum radiatum]|uniref:Uncharacterized protein n=1 Tax=Sesamum radiatum TaxID=300843 RepID=A0AAW2JEV9_SESRA